MRFNSLGQVVPDVPFRPVGRDDGDMPPPPADAESRRCQRILLGRIDHLVRGGRCHDTDTGEPAASWRSILRDGPRDMMDESSALAAADALTEAGVLTWCWATLDGLAGPVRALRRAGPQDTART